MVIESDINPKHVDCGSRVTTTKDKEKWITISTLLENKHIDQQTHKKLQTFLIFYLKKSLEVEVEQSLRNKICNLRKYLSKYLQIRALVQEKRKARHKWHQSRDLRDKTILEKIPEIENGNNKNRVIDQEISYSMKKATKKIKRPIKLIPPVDLHF